MPLPRDAEKRRNTADDRKRSDGALRPKRPSLRDRAVAYARTKATVTTNELQVIGIHRCYLSKMCKEGLLVRVAHGSYRAAEPEIAA
ncbi:MAG TPA: type IV toxin-antitoxin system AbiEi family antitoxin domain-containing protein [Nitrolancea sp.]|nr:type IV toxin-antitoxin system AbiEi family antitoxin domain-containing protein [Nitrolancea sp.]